MPKKLTRKRHETRTIRKGRAPNYLKKRGLSTVEYYKASGIRGRPTSDEARQPTKVTEFALDSGNVLTKAYVDRQRKPDAGASARTDASLFEDTVVVKVSEDDQMLVERLTEKYGDDFDRMAADIAINFLQYSAGKLRRLFARYHKAQGGAFTRSATERMLAGVGVAAAVPAPAAVAAAAATPAAAGGPRIETMSLAEARALAAMSAKLQ